MSVAKRSSKKRTRALIGLAVTVAALVAAGAFLWAMLFRADADVLPGRPTQVEIHRGSGTAEIARQLSREGVVSNGRMFSLRVRVAGAGDRLKAGTYDFESGSGYGDVIDMLVQGPQPKYVTVTIPEGFTVEQIAARLEKQLGIPAVDTLKLAKGGSAEFAEDHPVLEDAFGGSLEGYLFPKTYRFTEGITARQALEMMLDQFELEFSKVDRTLARSNGLTDAQVVVIASMVEREARLDQERPIVASVIVNRLERGMFLEIDATVEYVIPGNHFRLRYRDLGVKSPYNTYTRKGLPPGPICSPGLSSLEAAARPAKTDYFFYVLTSKDGSHTFATNKADFERAKLKSKEVFGR